MSSPQDRFKARREQLLKAGPKPLKLDPANVPAKAAMEFLASLRDDQPKRTPKGGGSRSKQPQGETLRTPLAAGEGWEQLVARINKDMQERRSKASPPRESGQTPDDQH